jgi:type II secretory pathway pseudopilin PulG
MNRNSPIPSGAGTGNASGHTLIEVLVAVSVLALLVVLIFQVIENIFTATRSQNHAIEAVGSGRRLLDVMTVDLQHAVVSREATLLAPVTNGAVIVSFLTTRRGPVSTNSSRFLAVTYSLNASNQVVRSYGMVGFARTNLLAATLNVATNSSVPLAIGVLGLDLRAVTESTNYPVSSASSSNWAVTNSYNGLSVPAGFNALVPSSCGFAKGLTNTTRAIEVTAAVVDDQNRALLQSQNDLNAVKALLTADPSTWRASLDHASIPSQTKSGIRILKKTITLP